MNPAKIGTAVGAQVPPHAPSADVQLQMLGPLRIWHRDVELDAGPRQQAYLLTLLLARAGRPLSVDSLIDLIWDRDDARQARSTSSTSTSALCGAYSNPACRHAG